MKLTINGQHLETDSVQLALKDNADEAEKARFESVQKNGIDHIELTIDVENITEPTREFLIGIGFKF